VVQRLGDFDPGLEFKTAMVYADASKRFSQQPPAATAVAAAAATTAAVAEQADVEADAESSLSSFDFSQDAGEGNDAATSPREVGAEAATASAAASAAAVAGGLRTGECAIVLGDRDVQETLRRLGGALTALTGRPIGKGEGEDGVAAAAAAADGGGGRSGGGVGLVRATGGDARDVKLEVSGREVERGKY